MDPYLRPDRNALVESTWWLDHPTRRTVAVPSGSAVPISCHGPVDQKRFYVDIAHRVRVEPALLEFFDLFLDVMIDPSGSVSEKDEHQLIFLPTALRDFTRAARDEVRRLIAGRDPLFAPQSTYYGLPADAAALSPATDDLDLR